MSWLLDTSGAEIWREMSVWDLYEMLPVWDVTCMRCDLLIDIRSAVRSDYLTSDPLTCLWTVQLTNRWIIATPSNSKWCNIDKALEASAHERCWGKSMHRSIAIRVEGSLDQYADQLGIPRQGPVFELWRLTIGLQCVSTYLGCRLEIYKIFDAVRLRKSIIIDEIDDWLTWASVH